jgi:trk system potassium uptake protein TrkA
VVAVDLHERIEDRREPLRRDAPPRVRHAHARDAGARVAHLVSGRMLDFIRFDDDFVLAKMYPPKFIRGVGLNESGVRSKYKVTVVGVKSPGKPFRYAEANTIVTNHDLIIVSGTNSDIERFAALDR